MSTSQMIKTKIKIGIPKALMYFEHGSLWESFFKALGCSVITSPETNKTLLEMGVKYCSNETCLPVKIFHGHVLFLKDKTDFIFIPRYISLSRNAFCCPKLCGLPDMTFLNLKSSINVIDIDLDFHNGKLKTLLSLEKIAQTLNIDFEFVQNKYNNTVEKYFGTEPDVQNNNIVIKNNKQPAIAVLGHPYVIHDNYLSMDLINKLIEKGFFVFTPSDNDKITKHKNSDPFYNKVFWDMGFDIIGSANIFAENPLIDGIIYLSPFACGIDSVLTEFIERKIKNTTDKHFLKITIDEHTGEAGFTTRIDAFLDMMPCLISK